jgi:hypothetical protein
MTMDITAIASVAPLQNIPGEAGRAREALGQEFGRLLLRTLLQGASAPGANGKGRTAMHALPLDMFADEFARQLAVQHQQMFGELLFSGTTAQAQR